VNVEKDGVVTVSRREFSRRAILDFDLAPRCAETRIDYIDQGYHRAVLPMLIAWIPICVVTALTPMLFYLAPFSKGLGPVDMVIALIMTFLILVVGLLYRWGSRRSRGSRLLAIDTATDVVSITHSDGLAGNDVLAPIDECLVATHTVLFNGHRGFATAVTVDNQLFLLSIHFRKRPALAYHTQLPIQLKSRLRRGPAIVVQGSMLPA
jgi:hypothetical protein